MSNDKDDKTYRERADSPELINRLRYTNRLALSAEPTPQKRIKIKTDKK